MPSSAPPPGPDPRWKCIGPYPDLARACAAGWSPPVGIQGLLDQGLLPLAAPEFRRRLAAVLSTSGPTWDGHSILHPLDGSRGDQEISDAESVLLLRHHVERVLAGLPGIHAVWRQQEKGDAVCVLHISGSSLPSSVVKDDSTMGARIIPWMVLRGYAVLSGDSSRWKHRVPPRPHPGTSPTHAPT